MQHAAWDRQRETWRQHLPGGLAVRLMPEESACAACAALGTGLYSTEALPNLPAAGCANLPEGCDVRWCAYSPDKIDALLERGFSPRWTQRPELRAGVIPRRRVRDDPKGVQRLWKAARQYSEAVANDGA